MKLIYYWNKILYAIMINGAIFIILKIIINYINLQSIHRNKELTERTLIDTRGLNIFELTCITLAALALILIIFQILHKRYFFTYSNINKNHSLVRNWPLPMIFNFSNGIILVSIYFHDESERKLDVLALAGTYQITAYIDSNSWSLICLIFGILSLTVVISNIFIKDIIKKRHSFCRD